MTDPENPVNNQEHNGIQIEENCNLMILKDLCLKNAEYFARDSTENGQRLYISFMAIVDNIELIRPKIVNIQKNMSTFDFDGSTPGNGYRSFLSVVDSAINYGIELNNKVHLKRGSILFPKTSLTKDVESCSHLLSSLDTCLKHLETLLSWSSDGNLFPSDEHCPQELLSHCEDINQYCFYGRNMGFQYCESLKNILRFIALSMAVFSEAYYSRGSVISKATNSFLTTTKYLAYPELRARRIVNISLNAGVDFCKAFWFLSESELMNQVPSVVSPSVAVSKIIHLPPEPFTLSVNGREIEVPVPTSHIGKKPVQVRLISHRVHEGMIGEASKKNSKAPTEGLLIHCHGGGFVAQSSKSHECYLRDWAKQLKVPILSIDYSLAPEAPFPRALEEVTYAYCWALKNHQLLGSTGEKIIAAGDSAGANILLSTSMKCINLGIPPPKGLFLAYVPILIDFIPSPSRLLCMMDPLLPFGFLMRCLKAYAVPDPTKICSKNAFSSDISSDSESFEEISVSDLLELQAHKSPNSETSDTMTYESLCSNIVEENGENLGMETSDIEKSERYVSDFLEKYVLDSDTDTDGNKPVMKYGNGASSRSLENSLQNRLSNIMTNLRGRFNNIVGPREHSETDICSLIERDCSLPEEFKFSVPENPYLSPYFGTNEIMSLLPPVRIITVELDPCLDDCVTLSKRLKALKNDIKLDILKGLPHGFLNLSMVSKEAYEGSNFCVNRIKELLDLASSKK